MLRFVNLLENFQRVHVAAAGFAKIVLPQLQRTKLTHTYSDPSDIIEITLDYKRRFILLSCGIELSNFCQRITKVGMDKSSLLTNFSTLI